MSPRLVLLSGPRAGQTFSLGAEAFSIGRHSENALQVLDPAASRQHCRVEPADGGFVLRDLGSRQGTFVNGRPIREHRLEEGDLVAVGETLLLFRTREEETVEAEPRLLAEEGSFTARTTIQRLPGRLPDEGLESQDFQVLLRVAAALQAP
ncbi:MAG TPA: FHA domain-containing protein, partial [Thermoanaerobaculia bacterium]|nr:FHA domain-containing protein [Thermoanaerobaculia bacterium]